MSTTEMPEMMTQGEYVAQTDLDRLSGIEDAGGLYRVGRLEAEHLRYVRSAVYNKRPVHFENRYMYKGLVQGLRQYSLNGNLAVYDSAKVTGDLTSGDIAFADYLDKKMGNRP